MEEEIINGYKGFDKDLKCRSFQYEVGKKYEQEGKIKCCDNGFHFCENPFYVFGYYPPNNSRYCEVEGSGEIDKDNCDSKVATSKINIGVEIGLRGIIDAGLKFIFNKVKWNKENSATGDYSGASATGDYSGASATGYYSGASATGDYSGASATGNCSGASATGYKSGASAGKGSIALATGMLAKAKGKIGAWIVVSECEEIKGDYFIKDVKCAFVDGEKIKEDVYYILENGEFKESEEQ